jgi:hypothetical protein
MKSSIHCFKTIFLSLFVIACGFSLWACSATYNTNFPPPSQEAKPEDSFPEKLGEYPRQMTQLKIAEPNVGFESSYGNGKIIIDIIHTDSNSVADDYFKNSVVPNFDAMSSHSRAQVNGQWYASGKDGNGRVWYGWVNQNWVFVVNAADQDSFDLFLKNFKYISK